MNELSFNQLMRGLKAVGYISGSNIKIQKVEKIFNDIKNNNLIGRKAVINEIEYYHLAYRFGILDGKIKTFKKASEHFNIPIKELIDDEIKSLQKLKLYFEKVF